jgi:hypothetical protein
MSISGYKVGLFYAANNFLSEITFEIQHRKCLLSFVVVEFSLSLSLSLSLAHFPKFISILSWVFGNSSGQRRTMEKKEEETKVKR